MRGQGCGTAPRTASASWLQHLESMQKPAQGGRNISPVQSRMPHKSALPKPKAAALLAWYDRHRRRLPWRALPGKMSDPYAVWLSEIMLQQTTVAAVKPYFEEFLRRWPTVEKLAAAKVETVMAAWAGLGYYARARNLHKCAQEIAKNHGGKFPKTEESLRKLPGIGPYTSAAIAAIAFGKYAVVVDGNVERVMARVFAVTAPLPKSKGKLRELAAELTSKKRAGDYAQAVMDLGATVCTPKSPRCSSCPWAKNCVGQRTGIAASLPRKAPKTARPVRVGHAFWMVRRDGCVLLRRREARGLLGGMTEIPCSEWVNTGQFTPLNARFVPSKPAFVPLNAQNEPKTPLKARWKRLSGLVSHTFTHFHLELTVMSANLTPIQAKKLDGPEAIWTPIDDIGTAGLPSVMRKVAEHALKQID
jgi:A/G-specific adenine glycosylase